MTQVFFSHSTADAAFALRLATDLRASGIPVWKAPESILPGEEWVPAIERGLTTSTHFLLLQSPAALNSKWVKFEFNAALDLLQRDKICIIPVHYQPCAAPLFWTQFQQVTGINDDYHATLLRIVVRLREEQPASPPKPTSRGTTINVTVQGDVNGSLAAVSQNVVYLGQPVEPPSGIAASLPQSKQKRKPIKKKPTISSDEEAVKTLSDQTGFVHSLAFCSNGRFLASAADDDHVKFWTLNNFNIGDCCHLGGNPSGANPILVTAFTFLSNPRYLVTGSVSGQLKIWDVDNRKERKHLDAHRKAVRCMAANYDQDNSLLASGADDGTVILWKMPYGSMPIDLETAFRNGVSALAFSPRENLLAASSKDGSLCVWDVGEMFNSSQRDKSRVSRISMQTGAISSLAFSPDGTLLAYASIDGSVGIRGIPSRDWRTELHNVLSNEFRITSLHGHFHGVRSVVFSPNGRLLASASIDETIKLWDLKSNFEELHILEGHNNHVVSLAFSPDSKLLASGSYGEIKIWNLTQLVG